MTEKKVDRSILSIENTMKKINDHENYYVGALNDNTKGDTKFGIFLICEYVDGLDDFNKKQDLYVSHDKFIIYKDTNNDYIICLNNKENIFNNSYDLITLRDYNHSEYINGRYNIRVSKYTGRKVRQLYREISAEKQP